MTKNTEWVETTEKLEQADSLFRKSRSGPPCTEAGPLAEQIRRFLPVPLFSCIQLPFCSGGRIKIRNVRYALILLSSIPAIACAPQRPAPGALAPASARTTNGMRAADLAAIDGWEARRVALLRNDGTDLPSRGVALARAGAWIAFAREAYVARPATREADDALAEAGALMAPFERKGAAPAARSALATGADRVSPDNWAEVERLASKPELVGDVASLAEAEIELVRASATPARLLLPSVVLAGSASGATSPAVALPSRISESSVSPLSCPAVQHIARAVALLGEADVVLQGEARHVAELDKLQQDERLRAPRVHFAVKSDAVGMPSAALLRGVAAALRAHPQLSLVIEGHADPRGGDEKNRVLSGRRAAMVRDILADSGVVDERMLVRQFGERQRAAAGSTAVAYARDRRVQLKFVLQDGEELPINEDGEIDLQIERVVIRSRSARHRKGAARVPARASSRSATVPR